MKKEEKNKKRGTSTVPGGMPLLVKEEGTNYKAKGRRDERKKDSL